ncbi:DUF2306 domain-containing protein [Hymenobacter properus]|uniref:DUF2306 domain-containing protein n=1 Tax=Hymenobacter properus TaxID=2791026 RepID=A0A931BCD0_9BACT|nr:hypothetical protein [Hymenobacter properus]MBF9141260.1 hypothetical protein [Hymenobacter properus]MBR7720070.1 hypothetical protein [Microvirga sp. SRT04]
MFSFLHSAASVVHLVAVGLALATSTPLMLTPKATRRHRYLGAAFVGSMAVALLSAFRIYFLFGRFGIVHYGAVASALALGVGTGAVLCRPLLPAWRQWHYLGMGISVTGLYAALVVESTYRLFPAAWFWWVTLGPAAAVLLAGALVLRLHFPPWRGNAATVETIDQPVVNRAWVASDDYKERNGFKQTEAA